MTREEVWQAVAESLKPRFGQLLDVRDVRRVRRVAGDAWQVTVVLAAKSGDVHVADVVVDNAGKITPALDADHVVEAVRRADEKKAPSELPPELADFGADVGAPSDGDDVPGLEMLEEVEEPIETRVAALIAKADPKSLQEARELLPRMLTDHDSRGRTLLTMAAVELSLKEPALARGYLEAAAREFADRFDLDALEKAATLALAIDGRDAFAGSPVHVLLERSRARLRPFNSIFDARSFAGLPEHLREKLESHLELRTLAPEEMLVTEGQPSRDVFVVKSGLLGVWLEKPSGGSWLVRCCFPGWLLGESSVLGGERPRCTASLRAERVSEVWVCPGSHVRALMEEDLAFGQRIAETKQMHRIDSFFSMHETMGQLDVQVRDEVLSCIQRLETFSDETLLLPANEVPSSALLVAWGSVALFEDSKKIGEIPADSFYGVRDAIHHIAPSVAAYALPGTTVAFFEGTRLQKLCERSPEHVVAVLERLG
ncbi:MAG: Crp/Fnr family transcriptional regulator [Labilithrix sp.]|nr:Crp/Fnr family transcriptional regulator [Labilithrix sp.]